jgi:hypothetical protein
MKPDPMTRHTCLVVAALLILAAPQIATPHAADRGEQPIAQFPNGPRPAVTSADEQSLPLAFMALRWFLLALGATVSASCGIIGLGAVPRCAKC